MSIKSRLGKLEQQHGGEPKVVFFTTRYERKDGSIDQSATISRANITWNKLGCGSANKTGAETMEEFEARVRNYASLTWAQAQDADWLKTITKTW